MKKINTLNESESNKINIPEILKRRIDFEILNDQIKECLDEASKRYISNIKKWNAMDAKKFNVFVVSKTIESFFPKSLLDFDYYNILWEFLIDYCYEKSKNRFNKIKSGAKFINESIRKEDLFFLRRTYEIDREFKRQMSAVYRPNSICRYDDGKMLVNVVTEAIVENLYFNTFYMVDDTSTEWEKFVDFVYDYIKNNYGQELIDYYNLNCGSQKMETNESELTEKCWPGYTQKGMKTMFGKRYPNCVKKTKK